ncbi:hypothetical protein [Carbonactinospora thermoautotrophica]|uniref:hypothetical protein n=1 Tax=Carbonactinospora thermoautotrophica TaxID=1469144 RepID=UPI003DA917ED
MSAGQEGSAPLAGIEYRCRAGQAQDSFVLVIRPDARAMLEVQGPTGVRRASAWLDPAVLRRLVGALRAGGFPALRQAPGQAQPGTPTRVLSVTGFDQPGQIELPWHDADAVGYGAVWTRSGTGRCSGSWTAWRPNSAAPAWCGTCSRRSSTI